MFEGSRQYQREQKREINRKKGSRENTDNAGGGTLQQQTPTS